LTELEGLIDRRNPKEQNQTVAEKLHGIMPIKAAKKGCTCASGHWMIPLTKQQNRLAGVRFATLLSVTRISFRVLKPAAQSNEILHNHVRLKHILIQHNPEHLNG
jgi:hypothetical protein